MLFKNVHILRFTLCAIKFNGFWQMHTVMYPPLKYNQNSSSMMKNSVHFTCSNTSLSWAPSSPWLIYHFYILPLPTPKKADFTQVLQEGGWGSQEWEPTEGHGLGPIQGSLCLGIKLGQSPHHSQPTACTTGVLAERQRTTVCSLLTLTVFLRPSEITFEIGRLPSRWVVTRQR